MLHVFCAHLSRIQTIGLYRAYSNNKMIMICDVDLMTGYNIFHYTNMDFSASVHDVICTRKIKY